MSFTIFINAKTLALPGMQRLKSAGCMLLFMEWANSSEEVYRVLQSQPVDGIISRSVDLSGDAIRACPTLKVISKHGVGVNNIDVEAATRRNIPVYVTPSANTQSVAELIVGLMLAAARRISFLDRELHAGRWSRLQDGMQLGGRRLGLLGFGQIGQRVATVCLGLGMRVLAFDPALKGANPIAAVSLVSSIGDLLRQSDVLSLHVPLTEHTRKLIGAAELALLPAQAILINTARGEVVDEEAVVLALRNGTLFAAGLDALTEEPLPAKSPLASLPNVVLTPHIGASTSAALDAMAEGAAANVLGYLFGNTVDVSNCVNPHVLTNHQKESAG
jgi:D-3-phosphoglycerate dehydrogenase / 2-oxoglutarate reductase